MAFFFAVLGGYCYNASQAYPMLNQKEAKMTTPQSNYDEHFMKLRGELLATLADIVATASTTAGCIQPKQNVLLRLLKAALIDAENADIEAKEAEFCRSLLVISSCFGNLSKIRVERILLAVRKDCASLGNAFVDLAAAFKLLYSGDLSRAEESLKLALKALSKDREKYWDEDTLEVWRHLVKYGWA